MRKCGVEPAKGNAGEDEKEKEGESPSSPVALPVQVVRRVILYKEGYGVPAFRGEKHYFTHV